MLFPVACEARPRTPLPSILYVPHPDRTVVGVATIAARTIMYLPLTVMHFCHTADTVDPATIRATFEEVVAVHKKRSWFEAVNHEVGILRRGRTLDNEALSWKSPEERKAERHHIRAAKKAQKEAEAPGPGEGDPEDDPEDEEEEDEEIEPALFSFSPPTPKAKKRAPGSQPGQPPAKSPRTPAPKRSPAAKPKAKPATPKASPRPPSMKGQMSAVQRRLQKEEDDRMAKALEAALKPAQQRPLGPFTLGVPKVAPVSIGSAEALRQARAGIAPSGTSLWNLAGTGSTQAFAQPPVPPIAPLPPRRIFTGLSRPPPKPAAAAEPQEPPPEGDEDQPSLPGVE